MTSSRLSDVDEIMFSRGFLIWKHQAHACFSTIFIYDLFNYMNKIIFKNRTVALYFQKENIKKKNDNSLICLKSCGNKLI